MTKIADLIDPDAGDHRDLLAAWRHERELDRIVRERGQQRPPPEPVPLHELAGHDGQGDDTLRAVQLLDALEAVGHEECEAVVLDPELPPRVDRV